MMSTNIDMRIEYDIRSNDGRVEIRRYS
jgi:hypothetical protein